MSQIKIFFIGNPFGGDDGIGPYLYNELKNHSDLQKFEILEMGVIGFDLVSYVDDDDKLIIVDAVHSDAEPGKVILLNEEDLSKDLSVVSQHDFGVEQTATILRAYKPDLAKIAIVGVQVKKTKTFSDTLSDELISNMEQIKKDVVTQILSVAGK